MYIMRAMGRGLAFGAVVVLALGNHGGEGEGEGERGSAATGTKDTLIVSDSADPISRAIAKAQQGW